MKEVNLWVDGYGWKAFDLESESTKQELEKRNIKIADDVTIYNDVKSLIIIRGSRDKVHYYGGDLLCIGCIHQSFNWWLENWESVKIREYYTDSEAEEYLNYIKNIQKLNLN